MEATIICLDNSEWMRNGDFAPSRLISQSDAAILMSTSKINQNPESAVAILSMAGKGPKALITLSNDDGKIMNAISSLQIEGKIDILGTLQLAQLTLKHKQNKSQKQRIILFIGSPVDAPTKDLVRIGKRLKKNNTAVDIVSFGETVLNDEKLQSFHDAVNNNDNSALLSVPSGPHNISDFLRSFPSILNSNASSNSGGNNNFMGVDPQADPELAAALRMSLEEYEKDSEQSSDTTTTTPTPQQNNTVVPSTNDSAMDVDMDDELQEAIRLSMMEFNTAENEEKKDDDVKKEDDEAPLPDTMEFDDDDNNNIVEDDDDDLYDDLDEEAQLALAMEMSMNTGNTSQKEEKPEEEKEPDSAALVDDALNDPDFMDSIFDNIEGVDANDPLIKSTIKDLNKDSESKEEDNKKSD